MQIPEHEGRLFYHLYGELMRFGNRRLQVVDDEDLDSNFGRIAPETRMRIRDAVFQRPEIIDDFVRDNPSRLTPDELAAVARWKHFVAGTFYVYRYLKQCAIFLGGKKGEPAYGVMALADPIEAVLDAWPLPVMVTTVLLPWRDKIIYDGMMLRYQILVEPSVRHDLDERYRKVKDRDGLVGSLPHRVAVRTAMRTARKTTPRTRMSSGSGASGNGASGNGASGNGASRNGAARNGAAVRTRPAKVKRRQKARR